MDSDKDSYTCYKLQTRMERSSFCTHSYSKRLPDLEPDVEAQVCCGLDTL